MRPKELERHARRRQGENCNLPDQKTLDVPAKPSGGPLQGGILHCLLAAASIDLHNHFGGKKREGRRGDAGKLKGQRPTAHRITDEKRGGRRQAVTRREENLPSP